MYDLFADAHDTCELAHNARNDIVLRLMQIHVAVVVHLVGYNGCEIS